MINQTQACRGAIVFPATVVARGRAVARGVTLVEVIFSMGVILIGLLGVMSILPLAGDRARDSVGLGTAPTIGDNIMEELRAHRWLSTGRLVAFNDANPGMLVPFDGSQPFCIDPMFLSAGGLQVSPVGAYDSRFFPFYKPRHDPTKDPSQSLPVPTNQTEAQVTRMRRVGILQRPWPQGSPMPPLLTRTQAFHVGESPDDLRTDRPKDRTANLFRLGTRVTTAANGLPYGGRFGSGEFSWIATVTANSTPGYVTVAIVVIRDRQRAFDLPAGPARNPAENATDERLATISFASGFRGGAGGVVELNGSANTVSRLKQGDWLMLSRAVNITSVENLLHRWYRVASLEGDPERLDALPHTEVGIETSPPGVRAVWRRRVYLDGPDFSFHGPTTTRTLATLVEGVVSVTEHVVPLSSL